MTRDDVIALSKAGFTAQQIMQMQTQPMQQMQTQSVQQMQTQPVQQMQTPSMMDVLRQQNDTLSKMVNMMQMSAINNMSQPPKQTDQQILASIINPPGWEQSGQVFDNSMPANAAGTFDVTGGVQ